MADVAEQESAGALLWGLADPVRLRLVAALVDEPRTLAELAAMLALDLATVVHQVAKLERSGLVIAVTTADAIRYRADLARVQRSAAQLSPPKRVRETASVANVDAETREVLSAFFQGDRLGSLPVHRRKKELVLEELLRRIPAQPEYREPELNELIKPIYEDFCAIRREWVDGGYMVRDQGIYRLAARGLTVRAS